MKNIVLRFFNLIRKGEIKFLFKGIAKRINSKNQSFGLKRDLNIDFQNPDALIDLIIRPFRAEDQVHFVADLQNNGLVEMEFPNCYVATTKKNVPCYRQWLIGPEQNPRIKEFWRGSFPVLKVDEALLESAFTVPKFRGNRIMPAAMARIAEKGKDLAIRWVITFVGIDNIPSLKGCQRSGFEPYLLRTEKWFLFNRTVIFEEVPKEMIDQYSKDVIS